MIIKRKTDNDLYKFTMSNAVYQLFPTAIAEYKFKCRKNGVNLSRYAELIKKEISDYCNLQLTPREYNYLKSLGFFSNAYLHFLNNHKSNCKYVHIDTKDNDLILRIKGPWIQTILDEVPILAIISEIYMREEYGINKTRAALQKLEDKTQNDLGIIFADFGTRRRYSYEIQKTIIKRLIEKFNQNKTKTKLIGTSNVGFAMEYGIKPIGTMTHEWLQAGQALTHPFLAQSFMLENWLDVYKGKLGIALTDVIGVDAFLNDFNASLAKSFDGVRHDSGDPYIFGEKIIKHYKDMGIDPTAKTIIFSDGLNFNSAGKLNEYFKDKIKCSFGIGTNLTNDIPGTEPLQIVIKLVSLNNIPVAKISDSPGKGMCEDENYVNFLKNIYSRL